MLISIARIILSVVLQRHGFNLLLRKTMKSSKSKFLILASLMTCLASSVAFGQTIFSQQFENNATWEGDDGRRYTTFATNTANQFPGVIVDSSGTTTGVAVTDVASTNFGTTNNNVGGNNPGPGFAYIPTGVAWQPNMIYSIEFLVATRNDGDTNPQFKNGVVQYGLWAGLPGDDTGPGDYTTANENDTFEAQSLQSLGTQGSVRIDSDFIGDGNAIWVSDLLGQDNDDQAFVFTTGSDVSGLGDMVLFVRTDTTRIHWDNLQITAVPEPGTYALFAGLVALVGTGLLRRLRKRNN